MNADFRDYVSYQYEEWDGEHCWAFWDETIQKFLCKVLRKAAG